MLHAVDHLHALCVRVIADAEGSRDGRGELTARTQRHESHLITSVVVDSNDDDDDDDNDDGDRDDDDKNVLLYVRCYFCRLTQQQV